MAAISSKRSLHSSPESLFLYFHHHLDGPVKHAPRITDETLAGLLSPPPTKVWLDHVDMQVERDSSFKLRSVLKVTTFARSQI
jgi:hypothetical protein